MDFILLYLADLMSRIKSEQKRIKGLILKELIRISEQANSNMFYQPREVNISLLEIKRLNRHIIKLNRKEVLL